MTKFWELLAGSVIIQSVVTLICIGTVAYMTIVGREVPQIMINITLLIVGFWFGSKSTHDTRQVAESIKRLPE